MQAVKLLHELSAQSLGQIHQRRRESLWAGVSGVLRGGRLSLTHIGRHLDTQAGEKHAIKRIDRLLSNTHLWDERVQCYRWIGSVTVSSTQHPIVLVDWSNADQRQEHYILRAALAVGSRAIPLYEEVHTRLSDPKVERRFLQRLADVLPGECVPIIVSDAGFRTPWFKAAASMGWYYVGRIRHRHLVCEPGQEQWRSNKAFYRQANSRPKCLGEYFITRNTPWRTRLYLYKAKPKGRTYYTAYGKPARARHCEKPAASAREPWLLATNLPHGLRSAHRIVAIYRRRMQIEEGFRDLKSTRNGLAFRHNLGRNPRRLAILLLIAALATLALWLLGLYARQAGIDRKLQANTVRNKAVLSVIFIGQRLVARDETVPITQLRAAIEQLRLRAVEQLSNF